MIITEEMWKTMQNNMAELQLKVLKLTGKVNAMDARIYGRARSGRTSNKASSHSVSSTKSRTPTSQKKCDLQAQVDVSKCVLSIQGYNHIVKSLITIRNVK